MELWKIITGVVIGLIVLVGLLSFAQNWRIGAGGIAEKAICKKSVEANSVLRIGGESLDTEIKCPTLFIDSNANDKNSVSKTLALAMADTWDEFLEGKQEVFDTNTDDYCVVRRVIKFNEAESYTGFFDYLLQNNPSGMNKPYFTYLTNKDVQKGVTLAKDNPNLAKYDAIDTSNQYATIFILGKTEHIGKITGAKLGGSLGTAGGVILSAGLIASGAGVPLSVAALGATAMSGTIAGFILGSNSPADWSASILLVPFNQETLNNLNCKKLPVSIVTGTKAAG